MSAASEILARDKALSGTEPSNLNASPRFRATGRRNTTSTARAKPIRSSSPSMSRMSVRAKIETANVSTGAVKEKAAARSGVMPLLGMRSRQGECKTYGPCRACDHSQGRRSAQASRGRLPTTFVYRVHFLCVTRDWRAWQIYHR